MGNSSYFRFDDDNKTQSSVSPRRDVCCTCAMAVPYIDGLVQDCNSSSALAMELPQSCTKPPILGWSYDWIIKCYIQPKYE